MLLPLGLAPTSVTVGERVKIRGNPAKSASATTVLGRELVKADGSVLPLNIGSAASRKAPTDVTATSIAGTWFPPRAGFAGYSSPRNWSLTERGRVAAAAFDARQSAHVDCIPVTAPTLMLYPVTSVVEVAADVVKFHVDWMASERVVYLDGRGHPASGTPSLHGHSIGHWEGATLVVDTVQFSEHKQGNSMSLPSGPGKHLVERFTLSDDRKHLRYETVLEDPEYLAAPRDLQLRMGLSPRPHAERPRVRPRRRAPLSQGGVTAAARTCARHDQPTTIVSTTNAIARQRRRRAIEAGREGREHAGIGAGIDRFVAMPGNRSQPSST